MAVLNFFKSLVIPSKMAKYRFMSILISICIFILSSYLLTIPVKPYLNRTLNKMVTENNYLYLQGINDIVVNEETSNVFKELESKECFANDDHMLECSNMDESLFEIDLNYVNEDNKKVNIKFVIDLFDEEGKAQYYPERKFTYSNEAYPNIDDEDYYLIIFRKERIYYQAYPTGIDSANVERSGSKLKSLYLSAYYDTIKDFKFSEFQSDALFGKTYLLSMLLKGHTPTLVTEYSMTTFFFSVVFTLIISFMFFLFFRKNGRLKKFKEYYNIAAIASIIPTLILFGIMWINITFVGYYIFGFAVYYLFVLYRINNAREIA